MITLSAESLSEMESLCREFLGKRESSHVSKTKETQSSSMPIVEKKQRSEEEVSASQVRNVLTKMMQSGQADRVYDLLNKYNAGSISELDPKHYADILNDAENS